MPLNVFIKSSLPMGLMRIRQQEPSSHKIFRIPAPCKREKGEEAPFHHFMIPVRKVIFNTFSFKLFWTDDHSGKNIAGICGENVKTLWEDCGLLWILLEERSTLSAGLSGLLIDIQPR
jgi:hypothetical protein